MAHFLLSTCIPFHLKFTLKNHLEQNYGDIQKKLGVPGVNMQNTEGEILCIIP